MIYKSILPDVSYPFHGYDTSFRSFFPPPRRQPKEMEIYTTNAPHLWYISQSAGWLVLIESEKRR